LASQDEAPDDLDEFDDEPDDGGGLLDRWWLVGVGGVVAVVLGLAIWGWADGRSFPNVWEVEAEESSLGSIDELTNPYAHEHADFAVFINGERVSFDEERYRSDEESELSQDVHIHAPRTDVVHKHRQNVTWGYFFSTIGWELTDTCITDADGNQFCEDGTNSLRFFVNDVEVDSLMNQRVYELTRVLITYGPADADVSEQLAAVGNQACIPSEKCEERIPPDEPDEPCSVTGAGVCD
jgi:hypothetical protein